MAETIEQENKRLKRALKWIALGTSGRAEKVQSAGTLALTDWQLAILALHGVDVAVITSTKGARELNIPAAVMKEARILPFD